MLISLVLNAIKAKITPILWGEPGVGKTSLIEAITRMLGAREPVVVLGSGMDPSDVLGIPTLGKDATGRPVVNITPPWWYDEIMEQVRLFGVAVLFFDEASNTVPAVQAPLLTVIQSRRVGPYKIPDEVLIIAAANPSNQAADGWLLSPPMANRLAHINYVPSIDDWFEGMLVAWNQDDVPAAEYTLRETIVGYLRQNDDEIQKIPETPEEAGLAWPSMRSWDNAARYVSLFDDAYTARKAMQSLVGERAEQLYSKWVEELELPPYELVLANPTEFKWKTLRADRTHMFLSLAIRRMTILNYKETLAMFSAASELGGKVDICAALLTTLTRKLSEVSQEAGVPTDKVAVARLAQVYGKDVGEALQES